MGAGGLAAAVVVVCLVGAGGCPGLVVGVGAGARVVFAGGRVG